MFAVDNGTWWEIFKFCRTQQHKVYLKSEINSTLSWILQKQKKAVKGKFEL